MRYHLWVKNEAKAEIKRLPGHVRQRIRRIVESLGHEPRPHFSRELRAPQETKLEPRRVRLDHWRVIYVVDEEWSEVGVLAVRERPPYDYTDLVELLAELD